MEYMLYIILYYIILYCIILYYIILYYIILYYIRSVGRRLYNGRTHVAGECQPADWTGRSCESWLQLEQLVYFSADGGGVTDNHFWNIKREQKTQQTHRCRTFTGDKQEFTTMGSWKNHVRGRLQQRDLTEKVPYLGVFSSCERCVLILEFLMKMFTLSLAQYFWLFSFSVSARGAFRSSWTVSGWCSDKEVRIHLYSTCGSLFRSGRTKA